MNQLTLLNEFDNMWLPGGGSLHLWPRFLDSESADTLLNNLLHKVAWEQSRIVIGGRQHLIPRMNAWFGDANAHYGYSGARLTRQDWFPELALVRENICKLTGLTFNSALLNLYRDGRDSVAWHSDDEPELGADPLIASLSLGATRRFDLRTKTTVGRRQIQIPLIHGSLLLMGAGTQCVWQHRIAKTTGAVGPRVNLTLRNILRVV